MWSAVAAAERDVGVNERLNWAGAGGNLQEEFGVAAAYGSDEGVSVRWRLWDGFAKCQRI
jgi:hypothetical protein